MDFLLGAAIIVLPRQHQIPLAIATTAIKTIQRALKRRKKEKRRRQDATDISSSSSSSSNPGQCGVTLQWSRLSCTLTDNHGNQRPLLKNIKGSAKPGRLLAICGPSGSGKTTLLNSISMRLPYSPNLSLQGIITLNDIPMPAPGVQFGFVAQEDVFFSQMTVRETLNFAAELRTGKGKNNNNNSSNSIEDTQAVVDNIISTMGLSKCADTIVGDSKSRGISGGEKKRLAIAIGKWIFISILFLVPCFQPQLISPHLPNRTHCPPQPLTTRRTNHWPGRFCSRKSHDGPQITSNPRWQNCSMLHPSTQIINIQIV